MTLLSVKIFHSAARSPPSCRDIQQGFAQATNGNKALKISCSADYTLSRLLTLRLYYDRQQNTPLVSSSSYPVVSADFGFSMKFSLTR